MNDQINQTNSTNPNKNFLIIAIIIGIIAVGAGGFILGKYYNDISKETAKVYESGPDASKIAEKETGKCASIQNISEKNQCWTDLAKEEKDENYCKKISADFPEARGDCYTELAIIKDDSLVCEKIISGSLHKSCLEYFEENDGKDEMADWKIYENEKYGYEIKYPSNWNLAEINKDPFNMTIWEGDGLNKDNIQMVEVYGFVSRGFIEGNLDYLKKRLKTEFNKMKEISITNGRGFYWINETKGGSSPSIYLVGKNHLFLMTYNIFEDTENALAQSELIFNQIISTFKFTESNEISDWKTYKNKEYGFEMKYPEDFFTEQVLQPKTEVIQCDYANFVNNCPTEIITVNDIPFCLQETGSAAAGTAYTTYNYTAIRNKECFVVSFAVPYPNCSNYLPINNQEIQKAYDKCILDNEITKPKIIDQIVSTFKFTE